MSQCGGKRQIFAALRGLKIVRHSRKIFGQERCECDGGPEHLPPIARMGYEGREMVLYRRRTIRSCAEIESDPA
jgi:hypothetical protein